MTPNTNEDVLATKSKGRLRQAAPSPQRWDCDGTVLPL